jgi:hypothetical protein
VAETQSGVKFLFLDFFYLICRVLAQIRVLEYKILTKKFNVMANIAQDVKDIIVDKLGVPAAEITENASF